MSMISPATLRRVRRRDRIARRVIMLGGFAVIASVIAILVLIVGVTLPLFRPAQIREAARRPLPSSLPAAEILGVGTELTVDRSSLVAHLVTRDGTFTFLDLGSGRILGRQTAGTPTSAGGSHVAGIERHAGSRYSLLWSDGSLSLVEVRAASSRGEPGQSPAQFSLQELASVPGQPDALPSQALVRASESGSITSVRLLPEGRLATAGGGRPGG